MIDIKHIDTIPEGGDPSMLGDIDISGGDLNIVKNAVYQHQRDIIMMHKGEIKCAPAMGVGASDFIDDADEATIIGVIRRELVRDKQTVERIGFRNGKLEIEAYYEEDKDG